MSNHARKLDCSRARSQRHRDKRASKRRETQAHSKQTPKSQRRAVQFPTDWLWSYQESRFRESLQVKRGKSNISVFQSNRKARKTYVVTGEKAG